MAKLARLILDGPFDPSSDEPMLKSGVLIAGKGRKQERTGREVQIPDVELDDDPANRRVFVRTPGKPDRFVPYERVILAEVAEAAPVLQPVKAARR